MKLKEPIPVTVLTGFLGAGKTTLLKHLMWQNHGYKCAIIINEFGQISIDNQLVAGVDEEILQLNNGCLCCRVRKDLIKSLGDLFRKQKRFDYVLIESTGLADPGPVAQTFFLPELTKALRLDAIVTVVDAKHIGKELEEAPEASAQIAFADVILVNKTDLVGLEELERIEARIGRMNPIATLHRTQQARVDPSRIFNLKARDLTTPLAAADDKPHSLEEDQQHADGEGLEHTHEESVRSFYIVEEKPLDLKKTEAWLGELLGGSGANIYRSKGILHIKGQAKRVVCQGVQMTFDAQPDRFWNLDEKRQSQMVFIGRDLDEAKIRAGFAACLAS